MHAALSSMIFVGESCIKPNLLEEATYYRYLTSAYAGAVSFTFKG